MSEGFVRCELFESFAVLTFDRPESRNAMTWKMYQEASCTTFLVIAQPNM